MARLIDSAPGCPTPTPLRAQTGAEARGLFPSAPAHELDPAFAQALVAAARGGVRLVARRCRVTLEELVLGQPIGVSFPHQS